jgi:hypothetical protein
MNYGQLYGAIGSQGYAGAYDMIYQQINADLQRQNLSTQDRMEKLYSISQEASKSANRMSQNLQKEYRKAQGGTNINHNSLMGLMSIQTKLLALKQKIIKDYDKAEERAAFKFLDDLQAVEDRFDPTTNDNFVSAVTTLIQNNSIIADSPSAQEDMIEAVIDNELVTKTLNKLQNEGERAAYVNYLIDRVNTELFDLDQEAAGRPAFKTAVLSKYTLTDENLTDEAINKAKEEQKAKIKKVNVASKDLLAIENLFNEAGDARKGAGIGTGTEQEQAAKRLFSDPEFVNFMNLYEQTNGRPTPQQLESFFQSNEGTTREEIAGQFQQAKELYQQNIALVPLDYIDVLSEPIRGERQRGAAALAERQALGMQQQPDLEQLAARRYLASRPLPMEMYTREQRKQLRKGELVPRAGSKIEQTDISIQALLRQSPEYREWYNSISKGEQIMQRYNTTAGDMFDEMQANPNFTPKGRAQKFAMQLFEATQAGDQLSADALVAQTAEGLRTSELQDEARAYYAALIMNRDASTSAPVETQEAEREAEASPDMDFTFMDRLRGKRAMRQYEKYNQPITPEPEPQPQSEAEQSAMLAQYYGDPNALAGMDLEAFTNRAPTQFEQFVYDNPNMTEAPTALPLSAYEAQGLMYPEFGTSNINPNRGKLSPQSTSQLEQGRLNALEYLRNQGMYK